MAKLSDPHLGKTSSKASKSTNPELSQRFQDSWSLCLEVPLYPFTGRERVSPPPSSFTGVEGVAVTNMALSRYGDTRSTLSDAEMVTREVSSVAG